jgi:hypothetical protein
VGVNDMAEAGVGWIELVASGADDNTPREACFRELAPTAGCRAIIRHRARFRDWNDEIFYDFISEAPGRKPRNSPLLNENGQTTRHAAAVNRPAGGLRIRAAPGRGVS